MEPRTPQNFTWKSVPLPETAAPRRAGLADLALARRFSADAGFRVVLREELNQVPRTLPLRPQVPDVMRIVLGPRRDSAEDRDAFLDQAGDLQRVVGDQLHRAHAQ